MKTVIFNKENPKGIIKDIEENTELFKDIIANETTEDRLKKIEKVYKKIEKALKKMGIDIEGSE